MTDFSTLAPAKINLFLEVLNRRDDGYHNVLLVNQTVDLADRLTFAESPSSADQLTITGSRGSGLGDREGENTILTALRRLRDRFGDIPYLRVRLEKNIPVGAGLGGGSADAGAVIRAVSEHYGFDWPREEMLDFAMAIGSDVPFAILGGTARVEGKGEKVAPLAFPFPGICFALVSPDVEVSTRWAYGALDRIPERPVYSAGKMIEALEKGIFDSFARAIRNSFESVVFVEHPELADLAAQLKSAGCDAAWMTGSGSNLVGLCRDLSLAEKVARGANWPCPARVVRPVAGSFPRGSRDQAR
jgi:4-diphosphocytidyl-2-C-methyl-D-erythritol kinase